VDFTRRAGHHPLKNGRGALENRKIFKTKKIELS
jgi:hypothetical protein